MKSKKLKTVSSVSELSTVFPKKGKFMLNITQIGEVNHDIGQINISHFVLSSSIQPEKFLLSVRLANSNQVIKIAILDTLPTNKEITELLYDNGYQNITLFEEINAEVTKLP